MPTPISAPKSGSGLPDRQSQSQPYCLASLLSALSLDPFGNRVAVRIHVVEHA
ncbi:MAG: hypothetical protein QNJ54_00800 [Prochloraceae cyanobacterium]|nr:hypothetical protein [Prochloraceae cyanobacterium]